jgi:hypothetical protein
VKDGIRILCSDIARFRSLLGTNYLAGMFRTPDGVASQVAATAAAQGPNRFMVDRVLVQTSVNAGEIYGFAALGPKGRLEDSAALLAKRILEARFMHDTDCWPPGSSCVMAALR